MWTKFAEQSDKEGWPAARFLAALAEHEIADRGAASNVTLPKRDCPWAKRSTASTSRSCDGQQSASDGAYRRRQLARKGANLLLFGPPGGGKSHPSGSRSSRMDGACCSCAPAISSNAYRSRAANRKTSATGRQGLAWPTARSPRTSSLLQRHMHERLSISNVTRLSAVVPAVREAAQSPSEARHSGFRG
jgi:hypothetical protein